MEGGPKNFSSPEEEVNFLREQLAQKEREVLNRVPEIDDEERVSIAKEQLNEYSEFTPRVVLDKEYQIDDHEVAATAAHIETSHDPVEDLLQMAAEKGIKNTLTILEKTENAYVVDEVHRKLIEQLHGGVTFSDLKEGVAPWHLLHMTLYEVSLPAQLNENQREKELSDLIGTMQQLYAGLRTIGSAKKANHFVIEIANANDNENIVFYVAVPDEFKFLFQKQTHSLFPAAVLTEQAHDYNIHANEGVSLLANVSLNKFFGYPIQMADQFSADPLAVILNALSKIDRKGGAAVQFVVRHPSKKYRDRVEEVIKEVEKGSSVGHAVHSTSTVGKITTVLSDVFSNKKNEKEDKPVDQEAVEVLRKKIDSELVEVNIRLVVSAIEEGRAKRIMEELKSAFNQFDMPNANSLKIQAVSGNKLKLAQKAFSFRQFSSGQAMKLSLNELATMIHLPGNGIEGTPEFKQSYEETAAAPTEMPKAGTLLGINKHRGTDKEVYITEEDRMRHFYIIGQTGTGKSAFMQNLVVQDIQAGHGVCMIDPHGSDIQDILGAIPPEREQDVIYFDPSYLDSSIGLNMLEYDPEKPEQKTFVIGELLSIFQKLYGSNPEALGPMFEQYFRNATMLVMEDPESGNTLMDIGRVMADEKFRRQKLAKATNPTVVSFWKDIATKAGGEASLENIIPYIVSKIDPLTSNDYIRPIVGQQTSAFDFRQLMDERKILLVNLSKGRLGELNANLIGMIFVGKILMAALSRVDDPSKSFPPFFLHIDEFQNISTPSIASILSEARKYKLGLTVAHQFIAQLDQTISDAVFGNVGSMAAFRVGNEDAQVLEQHFAPVFSANQIMNTPNYNAVMRVLAEGTPAQPFSVATMPPPESDPDKVSRLMTESYQKYGRSREEVEAEIQARYQKPVPGVPPALQV